MPQWCLARDSDPTSLVRLVSKPHRPVGAQQELRLFLLWGWGDIVYNQRCPPWSLHSERRWDGAVGLGHWKRSRLPRPPRGHPSHLPLPQPQSHSVSSWPRFSQLRPSRPLPPMQPLSSVPASPQPPGCPRSSRGVEAHRQYRQSGPSEVPPWSRHSCWVCVSAATLPSGWNQSKALGLSPVVHCVPAHRLPFTLHTSSLFSVFFLHLYFIDSKVGDVCLS